jgi:general secretion pathway protein F
MCEAGEMSGTLDTILIRLAEFTEAQNELQSKVKSALTYPVLMLVVTLGLLGFLFVFVIPKMVAIFESRPDLKLPWYTTIVFDFSAIMVNYWYIILGVLVLAFCFRIGKELHRVKKAGMPFR